MATTRMSLGALLGTVEEVAVTATAIVTTVGTVAHAGNTVAQKWAREVKVRSALESSLFDVEIAAEITTRERKIAESLAALVATDSGAQASFDRYHQMAQAIK